MKRYFDEDAREASRSKGDTELTLGSWMLLTVFFGLVVLCGLCFGLGYAVGSRGAKGPVFQSQPPAAGPSPQMPANTQQGKPSAAEQPPQTTVPPIDGTGQAMTEPPGADPGPAQVAVPASAPGTSAAMNASAATGAPAPGQQVASPNASGWRTVQPAMSGGTNGMQGAQPTPASALQPAMPGQGSTMVQIAALSSQEDASVLMGALRRRGYAVSAVRSPADNLIHVCVGPFSNRMDANSMRQKLLSDGYNAVVLQ
jgi:DedD protein